MVDEIYQENGASYLVTFLILAIILGGVVLAIFCALRFL